MPSLLLLIASNVLASMYFNTESQKTTAGPEMVPGKIFGYDARKVAMGVGALSLFVPGLLPMAALVAPVAVGAGLAAYGNLDATTKFKKSLDAFAAGQRSAQLTGPTVDIPLLSPPADTTQGDDVHGEALGAEAVLSGYDS